MPQTTERSIAVTAHGRYLVRPAGGGLVLAGFHGYAESADIAMARLLAIPRTDGWTLASIQGLHRFYRRHSDEVVASWMTRQDREVMISDNVAYVSAVLDDLGPDPGAALVFVGFSQGVAMAFRAACLGRRTPAAVIALGGDVPPELEAAALRRASRVLLGRGREDRSYTDATFANDLKRLSAATVEVEPVVVDGGHEWTAAFSAAAGSFLEAIR